MARFEKCKYVLIEEKLNQEAKRKKNEMKESLSSARKGIL